MTTATPAGADPRKESIKTALRSEITRRLRDNDLEIPMLPHIATQAMSLAQNPNTAIRDVATLVEQDQVISAKLINIANSPVYRGLNEIANLNRAILTIGLRSVSDLIFSLSVEAKVFRSKHYQERMTRLWEHSVGCAFLAQQLAKRTRRDAESAFLFGLLHDIGKTLVIDTISSMIKRKPEMAGVIGDDLLDELLAEFHGPVGGLMGRQWRFPDRLLAAIVFHHDPDAAQGARESALITAVANLLCHQFGIGTTIETVDLASHPWVAALGLTAQDVATMEAELPSAAVLFISSFM